MAGETHVGDTPLHQMTIKDQDNASVDVSGATLKTIRFRKPDGSTVTKTADFATDGTDGVIEYQAVEADHDIAGPWQKEARVTITSGNWYATIIDFPVAETL